MSRNPRTVDDVAAELQQRMLAEAANTSPQGVWAIRWVDPHGTGDINLIGPYNSGADRDLEMRRLAGLPGMGVVELVPSRTDRMCAGVPTPPSVVADVSDVGSFLAVVAG